jgi:hypothetical protein
MVFLLELIVGAKEFKLGFSGMDLTPEQMVSNIKVSQYHLNAEPGSFSQLILAVVVVYKMTVTLIKLSILMIYLRLGKQYVVVTCA